MKLVFMGTPEFAVPTLERCVAAGHDVVAVFTQPDRPKGRGKKLAMPPVKECALRLGLPVFQPERVRNEEVIRQLQELAPDAMVVVGYGQILPQSIIDIPPHGILNVHASLLPHLRGAAPIQWAIANGESRTGVTIMRIDAGLDTGDLLAKRETGIDPDETAVELGARLAEAGAGLLVETLAKIDEVVAEPQTDGEATYAPIIKKEDGHIDWSRSAKEIRNRIRGLTPWPGGYGFLNGTRFHIWQARLSGRETLQGRLEREGKKLYAGCGEGSLELIEVQLEGKKRMPVGAFLNGHPIPAEGLELT